MKKSLLILAILILAFKFSNSQTNVYHPFPEANAIWVGTYWYNVGGSGPCIVDDDYNLYIDGDTTIGIYTYLKLYKNGYISSNCPPPGYYYYRQYWGSFRQDIPARKVYLFENGNETLAYDFNLNVGDTLPATSCLYFGYENIVQSIDSTLIGSEYHKRFWLKNNYAALIEGIGTTLGAFAPIVPFFESGNDLWCVRRNNQIQWTSSPGNECSLTSISEYSSTEKEILITPNPFSLSTTIQTNNNLLNATLTIFDPLGEQVKQIKSLSGQKIILHRDNLPNGIYFIRLSQDSKTIGTGRLLIID